METLITKITTLWPIAVGCIFAAVFVGNLESDIHNQQNEINQLYNTQQQQMSNIQTQLNQIQSEITGANK